MEQDNFDMNDEGSLILKDSTVDGNVRSDKSIYLKGTVRGDVICKQRINMDNEAIIHGNVECEELFTDGLITGNVSAACTAVLGVHAVIKGNLVTANLQIHPEAILTGGLKLKKYLKK